MSGYSPRQNYGRPAPPAAPSRRCCKSDGSCVVCGEKKGPGFIGRTISRVLNLAVLFAVLVFLGGTLQSTGHPGAQRFGEALHTVTFTEEIQDWAACEGHDAVFASVHFLSRGVDLSRWVGPDHSVLTSN